jgi:hypothetical protein
MNTEPDYYWINGLLEHQHVASGPATPTTSPIHNPLLAINYQLSTIRFPEHV